ncbi:MAG: D-aminoacylase [Myxococcota bacterium]|nr:D-aminoacylase [Myxococcota bacterium]
MAFDLVIRGATLYDGSGDAPRRADVALRDDRIAAVGEVAADAGTASLDARGLALAPGFIDVHTHDDFAVLLHPEMGFKVQGGVTTVVVGNCGMGAAPHAQAALMARAFHPHDTLPTWSGHRGYLAQLDAEPASCNVAMLAGHGTLRLAALGGAARAPDAAELRHMQAGVREALEAGALGLSTGLIYEPGRHADTDEIVALASELSGSGALYTTHMRDEASRLLEAVREAIEIGERAGVPVQISHHKAAGRENWGRVTESLRLIEQARARGLDVTADQYPYTAGSTVLAALVSHADSGLGRFDGSEVTIASAPGHPEWEGRSLAEIAAELEVTPLDAARRVLDTVGMAATVVLHSMCDDDVRTVLRHPTTMIGSDGIPTLHGKPHPRLYGTFARVLGHYARDEGVLSLSEAVHRMTGFPARKFGLSDRGALRAGACADLVLFDPARIDDVATYADPHRPPTGIAHVFVNGRAVVRDGEHTGARPGLALRRSA